MDKPTYAELEAEVARLREELDRAVGHQSMSQKLHHDCAKSWLELYKERDEARQWARHWKRKYLWILSG